MDAQIKKVRRLIKVRIVYKLLIILDCLQIKTGALGI